MDEVVGEGGGPVESESGGPVRRGVDWNTQPLGTAPDAELARGLGVSRERVRQERAARGIAAYETRADPPLTEGVELADGFAVAPMGVPPGKALSALLGIGLRGLAEVTKGRIWVRRELAFISPRALFSLAEAVDKGAEEKPAAWWSERTGTAEMCARAKDLVVGIVAREPGRYAFATSGGEALVERVRDAFEEMAAANGLDAARSVIPREELTQAEATWPGAIGSGRTPGDAIRSAVLFAMRVPDQFGVDTQVARVLGIPVKGWSKSRTKPGAIDAMVALCVGRGWVLAHVPGVGEDERWIAGDPVAFGIPALAPAVKHEIELRRNDGGGPKWLGVRCSCGWSEGAPGTRKDRLEAAGARHLREAGVAVA